MPLCWNKPLAATVSLLMLGAVLSPIQQNWRKEPRDSFPLSYYPMYAKDLRTVEHIPYVVGLSRSGARYPVPHSYLGPGGRPTVNIHLRRLVFEEDKRSKQDKLKEFCRKVAKRISRSAYAKAGVETVQIIIGAYDLSAYLSGRKAPLSERIVTSCEVNRQRQ